MNQDKECKQCGFIYNGSCAQNNCPMSKDKTTPETDVVKIFKKHYEAKSGKQADEVVMSHMQYCVDAMNEFAISERTRIIEEAKAGLPTSVQIQNYFLDLMEKGMIKPENITDRTLGAIWYKQEASLILSSQRIEAEIKAMAFAEFARCRAVPLLNENGIEGWYLESDINGDKLYSTSELYTFFESWYGK